MIMAESIRREFPESEDWAARLAWASGFVEGRAQQARPHNVVCRQRLQRLAGIRITPRFARPLWELLGRWP
jgi:hypothetical protein